MRARMTAPFQRYLRLLGIAGRPSGLDGLRCLVRRHLAAVPFENISKLRLVEREGAGRVTTLAEFLDGIEYADLGGTCYTLNPFLTELLRELGYDADLLGADMSNPNVHTCIRVRVDSVDYHVDVGFAAPFREPLRLDSLPVQVDEGANRYVLDRDAVGCGLRLSMFTGGGNGEGYLAHDPPRPREFFDSVVLDSYSPGAWFMNRLRISRIFDEYSLDLINWTLYRHEAGRTTVTRLASMEDLARAVRDEFRMPRCPVESAVQVLERRTGNPLLEARG
jgi:arylamine N-acetyltransferase